MNCHGSINMSSHSISLQKLHWVFPVGKIRILCHHIHTLSLYSTMNMDITKDQWHLGNYKYSFNKIRKNLQCFRKECTCLQGGYTVATWDVKAVTMTVERTGWREWCACGQRQADSKGEWGTSNPTLIMQGENTKTFIAIPAKFLFCANSWKVVAGRRGLLKPCRESK